MPIYVYEVVLEDGSEGPTFEVHQSLSEPPLKVHPVTGHKVRRVYTPPYLSTKHTPGKTKKLLDNNNIEKAGFTKYVKDKLTGDYNKVAGNSGPSKITRKK